MSTVRDHYASHLGPIYLWMAGGFDNAVALGMSDLESMGIQCRANMVALDLGAGFGMHAIPLARAGFSVTAIDSSALLLDELRIRAADLPIRVVEDDILNVGRHVGAAPQIVLCMGDTLTHLQTDEEVERLFGEVSRILAPGGLFGMTFRDYSSPAAGDSRFFAVRGDSERIHTCFLEEESAHVRVHDIVHERMDSAWQIKVSSYRKLRLSAESVMATLRSVGLNPAVSPGPRGMVQITARSVAALI